MICARSALLNLFILTLCVRVVTTVCHRQERESKNRLGRVGPQRASAALRALSGRSLRGHLRGARLAADEPAHPPNATAAGFLAGRRRSGSRWPVAKSTTALASWFGSRGIRERLGIWGRLDLNVGSLKLSTVTNGTTGSTVPGPLLPVAKAASLVALFLVGLLIHGDKDSGGDA